MSNEFSQKMSEILSLRKEEATRLRSRPINPEHILLGIIRKGKGSALDKLGSMNVNVLEIKEAIERRCSDSTTMEQPYSTDVEMSMSTARILRFTTLEARSFKAIADTEHLLLGILKEKNNLSLIEAELLTGRTHQIRAHMAHIGHALLGDGKYGINRTDKTKGYKYQALYSYRLIFDFGEDDGYLGYLSGKQVNIDPDGVWFLSDFPSATVTVRNVINSKR